MPQHYILYTEQTRDSLPPGTVLCSKAENEK